MLRELARSILHHGMSDEKLTVLARDYSHRAALAQRARLLQRFEITTVLDIGANEGQFALEFREHVKYRGKITSFEPVSEAFAKLQARAAADPLWKCRQEAISDVSGKDFINVSANSFSSSLLEASEASLAIEPSIGVAKREEIIVHRLDDIFDEVCPPGEKVYLKIDTQGLELKILQGAAKVLERISILQIEVSFYPVYVGEMLAHDMLAYLYGFGFKVITIEPAWEDPKTGELLQADVILIRR